MKFFFPLRKSPGRREGAVSGEILRFQPDSVLLERATPPLGARVVLYAVSAGLALLIAWSVFGHIDRVVVGDGRIVTATQPLVLQSYGIALVRDIRVAMGQRVKKGDILVVLDPTFAQADMNQLRERIASLEAHRVRLQCELDGQDYPPPRKAGEPEPVGTELREQRFQTDIRSSRSEEFESHIRAYDEAVKKLRAEIAATEEDLKRRQERLRIYREFERMRENLYRQDIEARASYLEIRRDRLTVESDEQRLRSSLQESRSKLAGMEADRTAFVSGWRSKTAQELVEVRRELDQALEQYSKALKRGDLANIRAPVDAVVLELAQRNVGSVANEAEALVTLVPEDAELELEVDIQPQDVGYIRPGQPARVRLATMPFQKHGKLDATLKTVSRDAFQKERGGPGVYRARLTLPVNPLKTLSDVPDTFTLLPGMTATAEINVGERRIIEYFLYPVLAGFDAPVPQGETLQQERHE
ncbi:MAG: HlyD family type I secretion periplasmic adaptor subunit [Desulfovibrio sp.]|nr:HlyD family type I secretion periplasmic adaptor subunit [Desulfovibrio sp.]